MWTLEKKKQELPDDLLISCLARVSRLYYPTLSLVSKSFRSLLTSPELCKARSLLGNTEKCLYMCLKSSSDLQWFTLYRKPAQTLTYETSKKKNIINNNKKKKKKKSSGYVLAKVPNLHSLQAEPRQLHGFVNFVRPHLCEIDNVFYRYCFTGKMGWYDTEVGRWRDLKGVVGLPEFPKLSLCICSSFKLADYGGKMAASWEEIVKGKKMIWCAVIAFKRRQNGEIWGKVEWVDHVLTAPQKYDVVKVLVTNV